MSRWRTWPYYALTGLLAALGIALAFPDGAGAGGTKVGICHRTASDTNPYTYIEVAQAAVQAHLDNGHGHPAKTWKTQGTWHGVVHAPGDPRDDYLASGPADCTDVQPTETPTETPSETPTSPTVPPTTEPTTPTSPPTTEPTEPTSPPTTEPTEPTHPPTSPPTPPPTSPPPTRPTCEPGVPPCQPPPCDRPIIGGPCAPTPPAATPSEPSTHLPTAPTPTETTPAAPARPPASLGPPPVRTSTPGLPNTGGIHTAWIVVAILLLVMGAALVGTDLVAKRKETK